MIKINLTEIQIKDLNENVYQIDDLHKQIGNVLFTQAHSIELSDLARVLHKGDTAEVSEQELNDVLAIVSANPFYKPFAHSQVLDYFKNKLDTLKEKKNGKN